jgi:hypothetical protein
MRELQTTNIEPPFSILLVENATHSHPLSCTVGLTSIQGNVERNPSQEVLQDDACKPSLQLRRNTDWCVACYYRRAGSDQNHLATLPLVWQLQYNSVRCPSSVYPLPIIACPSCAFSSDMVISSTSLGARFTAQGHLPLGFTLIAGGSEMAVKMFA